MTWSPETEALRERYHMLYGLTQGMGLCSIVVSVAHACGLSVTGAVLVGWAGSLVLGVLWRRSWKKYRAALLAERDQAVAAAKEEMLRLTELLRGPLQ